MTQSGGSAAINGFLYQILQHLDWLTEVRLSGTLDGQEVKDACLILEPQAGGDAQAHTSGLYLVEQYKTRANGTWSLSGLAAVLRDLRKSVSDLRPEHARYRFVTDGRCGRLGAFKSFLARLNAIESPDDLDNDTKRKFTNTLCLSDREFLDHVVETTRSKDTGGTTAEEREIIFHLLRRFDMEFDVSRDEVISAVEARLRPYVCDLGDESGVRRRLSGSLMERLGAGETRLDNDSLDAMFRGAGLRPDRLRKVIGLPQKLKESMRRHSSYLRYRRENDVRDVPCWPETKPVLLVTGESGAGKSWQLARLMEESAGKGEFVVFVRGGDTAEDILRRAAREIWQVGLGETSDKTPQAISNFFREEAFRLRPPLYTIAVDDVQSVDLARSLVRQDWTDLGARLVLTVPLTVARVLGSTDSGQIRLHRVDEFSVDELDSLLKMSGHRWVDLPEDLKRLLRKPVLAGLFLDLFVSSFQDAPQSEFEIFQAYWDRIEEKGNKGDTGIVVALADLALQGKLYPLPRKHWGKIELDNENLTALEAAGWLNCLDHGEVEFAHDRLLNWAAAQSLSRKFEHGDLSVDELFSNMTGEADGHDSDPLRRFGYVPMDTLWLLAARTDNNQVALDRIVEKMENHRAFGRDSRYLYTNLLLTLGQRAIPILLQRLNIITANSAGDYRVGLIGEAFAKLACRESVDIRPDIASLLRSRSWDQQSVAVKALATAPDPGHLDRLWEVHQQRLDAREHTADRRVQRGHEATFSALRVGVARQPGWLRDRIRKADPSRERVSELAYLLSGLDDPRAVKIWRDVRDVLMEKVPKSNPRSLLHCIARFADHEKKDFVVEHLSYSGEIISTAALSALAVLEPQEAINQLTDIDDEQAFFWNDWLPLLLRADSELIRARLRELADSNLRGQLLIEQYFEKRPADLDEATLGLVLRMREKQLRDNIGEVTTKDILWPYFPLRFLGRMCCPELLRRLQDEAGGQLEADITELACSRLRGNSRVQDHVLEAARRTLVLFAGAGISDLVNRELDSEHFRVRHGGLNWAWVGGNDGTIERLSAIARRPVPCDSAGKHDPDAWQEYYWAMIGLAALGADDILVDILSNPEVIDVPLPLADFRAHRGPMPKSLTDQAIRAMRSPETSEEALRCAFLIAWLSGDDELIPDVRAVLDRLDPESQNALHACIALQALGDGSAEFARMAERLAYTEENAEQGLDVLIGLGREGVEGLVRWVEQKRNTDHVKHRESVIRALYEWTESRHHAVEAAVEQCLKNRFSSHSLYEIAAESDNRTVRERILEDAFAEHSIMVRAPLDAIRGLAKFDTNRAAEAVEFRLANHPQIKRELCRLLVQVAPESAAEKLVGAAVALEHDSFSDAVGRAAVALERDPFPDAVGRALRRLDPKAVVDVVMNRLRGTETERKVVCQIAGWLPVPEIAEALEYAMDRESAGAVRRAALEALYRHREEEAIRGLFSEFQTERCAARRWAFFVAILETADPHLLTDYEDSLWLDQLLTKDVPYAFKHYAHEVLK